MSGKSRTSETVKVSRLGCMRKSTVESDFSGDTVEHVELWTGREFDDSPEAKRVKKDKKVLSKDDNAD
ncbi:MAG: hypothetical protein MUO51_08420 [Woeseiaceae bacterium]|nr:hypothetical protein [Woeseiaceae bacterium]